MNIAVKEISLQKRYFGHHKVRMAHWLCQANTLCYTARETDGQESVRTTSEELFVSSLIGQQWGNYRLVRLLGEGGFAEVYLAEHVHLGMQAAVKILHAVLSENDIESFQQEARVIASLTHPHIVRLRDFDLRDGRPFLVLEYAANGTLRHRHPRGTKVPLPTVVAYVMQVAQAIQYAHERKLVHRDIKPGNMLIGQNGDILLSDFGLVTVGHATSSMKTMSPMGTLAYMAPEQIEGRPRAASDQYALAMVVYQWLTGVLPFSGSSAAIIIQHMTKAPQPLRELEPTLPDSVEAAVLQALSKDPKLRFGSVWEFAQALQVTQAHDSTALEEQPSSGTAVIDTSSEDSVTLLRASQDTAITAKLSLTLPTQRTSTSGVQDTSSAEVEAITRTQPTEQQAQALPPPPAPLPDPPVVPIKPQPSHLRNWLRLLIFAALAVVLISGSWLGIWYTGVQAKQKQHVTPQQHVQTVRTEQAVTQTGVTPPATTSVTATVAASPTPTSTAIVIQTPVIIVTQPIPTVTQAPAPTAAPTLQIIECPGGYLSSGTTCNVDDYYGYQTYQPANCVCPATLVTAFANSGTATVNYTVTTQVVTPSHPNWVAPATTSGTIAAGSTLSLYWDTFTGSVGVGTYETHFTVSFSYNATVFQILTFKFVLMAY